MTTTLAAPETRTGGSPAGMWWVAWRLQRTSTLLWLGVCAALALAYVILRWTYVAAIPTFGPNQCPGTTSVCWSGSVAYEHVWALLRLALLGLPLVLPALVGGSLIAQERDRGTQVFALTQSVGRTRWYLTKVVVAVVPLTLAVFGLTLVAQWVQTAPGLAAPSLLWVPYFQMSGVLPAVFTLLGFGIAIPVGAWFRSVVPAVGVAFVLATGAILGLGYGLYPDLVPHQRATAPVQMEADGNGSTVYVPGDALALDGGYLTAAGVAVTFPRCPEIDQPTAEGNPSVAVYAKAWNTCAARAEIATYFQDYIDASELARLRWTVSGIGVAVAALGLGLGWWRVRRRVV